MKKVMFFSNGVKIKYTEDVISIIAADGEVTRFGADGKKVDKKVISRVENSIKYFEFIGAEKRDVVEAWYEREIRRKKSRTVAERAFLMLVKVAISQVFDNYYIATLEPSLDENGMLYYKAGDRIACDLSCAEWKKKAQEFAPEYDSALATKYQLVLWYAYRIAKGFWTLSYVCDDSSNDGNYWNSPNATHTLETSGARVVCGVKDGVGNTYKIVTDHVAGFCLFGGHCGSKGNHYPVAKEREFKYDFNVACPYGSGVLVLKNVSTIAS